MMSSGSWVEPIRLDGGIFDAGPCMICSCAGYHAVLWEVGVGSQCCVGDVFASGVEPFGWRTSDVRSGTCRGVEACVAEVPGGTVLLRSGSAGESSSSAVVGPSFSTPAPVSFAFPHTRRLPLGHHCGGSNGRQYEGEDDEAHVGKNVGR